MWPGLWSISRRPGCTRDSACSLPPYSLSRALIDEMKRQTVAMAIGLKVVGLMNVQFAIKGGEIYVLEVNPRASRTVPFVAKAVGSPIASIAAQVMAGAKLSEFELKSPDTTHYAVKEVVLPFARFPGVDTLLGPEMRSTGEVMGLDTTFSKAFLKAQMGAGTNLPRGGSVFVSIKEADKAALLLEAVKIVTELGFTIKATRGTASFLRESGFAAEVVNKVYEGRPDITDLMKDGGIDLVFNTTEGAQSINDSREIRRIALYDRIPYYTTAAGARAAARAMQVRAGGEIEVFALQSIF